MVEGARGPSSDVSCIGEQAVEAQSCFQSCSIFGYVCSNEPASVRAEPTLVLRLAMIAYGLFVHRMELVSEGKSLDSFTNTFKSMLGGRARLDKELKRCAKRVRLLQA